MNLGEYPEEAKQKIPRSCWSSSFKGNRWGNLLAKHIQPDRSANKNTNERASTQANNRRSKHHSHTQTHRQAEKGGGNRLTGLAGEDVIMACNKPC